MVGGYDLSVLISQVPRVQKVQGDIQQNPLAVQEGLQREVEKKQEQEKKEVQRSEEGRDMKKVGDEGERKGKEEGRRRGNRRDRGQKDKKKMIAEEERGKIVDLEV